MDLSLHRYNGPRKSFVKADIKALWIRKAFFVSKFLVGLKRQWFNRPESQVEGGHVYTRLGMRGPS